MSPCRSPCWRNWINSRRATATSTCRPASSCGNWITRAGAGTKIVFTGDIYQIDHPYLDSLSNGLSYLISRMVGQSLYAHITLEKGERSRLADLASDLL